MIYTNVLQNRRMRMILLLVVGTFLAFWLMLGLLFYNFSFEKFERQSLLRLAGISDSLSLQIDGEAHLQLMKTYPKMDDILQSSQDSLYQAIHLLLKANKAANMLKSPIYTLMMSDGNSAHYQFGVTSEDKPYYKHKYTTFHQSLDQNFKKGGTISTYKDEFGTWLSAFAPIKDKKGVTVAVVMVDEKFDDFLDVTKVQLVEAIIQSVIVFAIFIIALLSLLGGLLILENRDKLQLSHSNSEKEIENEVLSTSNAKLSETNDFRKEMTANISHDLRTPVANIIGFLEIVLEQYKTITDHQKSQYIKIAYQEANRLNALISDLFELTKLESSSIQMNFEPFNIYELVSDSIQKYQFRIKAKHVELTFDIEQNLGLAYGDIRYVDRLFQNLLDNAVKFVNDGGQIKIWILDAGNNFKVKVCNTGELIDAADVVNIFDRNFRRTSGEKSGAGLGLAIAKRICDLHNCSLVVSVNAQVNSFEFTLPKAKVES